MKLENRIIVLPLVIVIILGVFLIIFVYPRVQDAYDRLEDREIECEKNNIEPCFDENAIKCFNDCQKLDLKFFKINDEAGLFVTECYCLKDNEPKKIW